MNMYSRILAALLLAGASSSLTACGDDEEDNGGKPDAGKDAGSEKDADEPDPDEDADVDPEGDAGTDAGGGTEDDAPELGSCPTHPNVMVTADYCVLNGTTGSEIKTDLTLSKVKGKKGYLINKGVFVGEDVGGKAAADTTKKSATLSITKGTTLFGGDNLAFLLVNRGSKLMAEGTAKYPVVFTSSSSDLKPGRWGGVILNGRAPSNRADASGDVSGEAGTGKYSGPDAKDNSGTVKYVRIEFGGSKIDDKNELNGLALQGVGSGTTIDYLHVHANDDDGVEFFGGTVNAKHVIVTAFADDGLDWTDGWNGSVQYYIAQQWKYTNPGTGTNDASNGIEADNQDVNVKATPVSEPTLSNITLLGASDMTAPAGGNGMNLRRATKGHVHNTVVLNFKTSCITLRGPDSVAAVGAGLTLENSRIACDTQYETAPGRSMDADPVAAAKLFDTAGNNEKPADKDALYEDAFAQSASVNFNPKKDSPLLSGGKKPSGAFFDDVSFIGAVGPDDWTAGEWFKVTPFAQ
jgi:hypothetical protein